MNSLGGQIPTFVVLILYMLPLFFQTGLYDPYSDDPRFAVKKVEMCGLSGFLGVAGTAGQIIVLQFAEGGGEPSKIQVKSMVVMLKFIRKKGYTYITYKKLAYKTSKMRTKNK